MIELCKNTDPNAKGWRPTRRPELDVLGHTRITLQNHVERLEEIKQDYVSQLEEKKRYYEQLKEQIKELDDGSLFASKVDGFQL
ncbi:unnamed protein product [Anisakis simplex]|uniref:Uncharacterized protein n=1 Tax=Anisakis simplex TaxID=6269 RepID=A0A3P6SNE0_ANISI|nr:unnamed protein product [Anisakis simplex]